MALRSVLGLFTDENVVADTMDSLRAAGYTSSEYELLTGVPTRREPSERRSRFTSCTGGP